VALLVLLPKQVLIQLTMKKFLGEELFKALLSIFTTALGVYFGIKGNAGVEKQNKVESYNAMLKAVRIEATEVV